MMDTAPLPEANSPQVLTRLLEGVSRGVRTTRGLQEALGVGVQTVRAYVHAAAWLSLVEQTDPVSLSPLGLEYVYAGSRRPQVYARAIWSTPLAADLLVASDGKLPETASIERALARAEEGLSPIAIRNRASAVRGLIAPVVGRARPKEREEEERQLGLPLGHAPTVEHPPALPTQAGEYDPDVYRYLLACLLDHGELSLGHVRALLDRAGAQGMGIGGLIDIALTRGDAVQLGERLVATSGAVARRDLASATTSVILSDPRYRQYLDDALAAREDRAAAIRRDRVASRFRPWDRRLFGRAVPPEQVRASVERILLDRPLCAFPTATPSDEVPAAASAPFLDVWEDPGLYLALPPSFAQLQGGLSAVNRVLRKSRGVSVTLPDLSDRPTAVHGGIVHPGEPVPRTVPDVRTLRQRVLMHAPYAAITAAILLLHRLAPDRVAVSDESRSWVVRSPRSRSVPLLDWIDRFASSRGWVPVRRREAGLLPRTFVEVLEVLGIGTSVGRTLVLSESLFAQLQSEAEEVEICARLQPLGDAVDAHLSGAGPLEGT